MKEYSDTSTIPADICLHTVWLLYVMDCCSELQYTDLVVLFVIKYKADYTFWIYEKYMTQISWGDSFENSVRKDLRFLFWTGCMTFVQKLGSLCLPSYERAKTGHRSSFYLNCYHMLNRLPSSMETMHYVKPTQTYSAHYMGYKITTFDGGINIEI